VDAADDQVVLLVAVGVLTAFGLLDRHPQCRAGQAFIAQVGQGRHVLGGGLRQRRRHLIQPGEDDRILDELRP
jgi:hypothetical protein